MPKRSKKGKKRSQRRAAKARMQGVKFDCSLSPVARAYVDALTDPMTGPLVGVPNGSAVLTRKYRVWARGTVTAGGGTPNNDIAVLINPWASLTNNQYSVSFKAPPTASTLPADMNNTLNYTVNSPYVAADFDPSASGNKISGRVVAAQFRMRYAGTTLNKGGSCVTLQEPTHGGLNAATVTSMLAHTTCRRWNITTMRDGWISVSYRPADVYDTYFVDTITRTNAYDALYKSDGVTIGWDIYPFMGAYATLPAASSPLEFEYWAIVEYAGPNVPGKTVNHPDPQGFACVLAGLNEADQQAADNFGGRGVKAFAQNVGLGNARVIDGVARNQPTLSSLGDIAKDYAGQLLRAAAPYAIRTASDFLQRRRQPMIMDVD